MSTLRERGRRGRIAAAALSLVLLSLAAVATPAGAGHVPAERGREAARLSEALATLRARLVGDLGQRELGARSLSKAELESLAGAFEPVRAADLLFEAHLAEVRRRIEDRGIGGEIPSRLAAAEERHRRLRAEVIDPLVAALAPLAAGRARTGEPDAAARARAASALAGARDFLLTEAAPPDGDEDPILAASTLPYRRGGYAARPPLATPVIVPAYLDILDPGSSGADLAPTAEAPLSSAVLARAAALGHDYVKLYELVKNEITTEWYAGSMKGADETLAQHAGNDVDQASLLIALYRASNLPARYVHGVIERPIEAVAAELGLAAPAGVPAALARAGVAHRPVIRAGRLAAVELEHTWVEAHVPYTNYRGAVVDTSGRSWVALMPALKAQAETPPTGILADIGETADAVLAAYLAAPQTSTPLAQLRQRVETHLALSGGSTYAQQLGSRTIVPERAGLLPASLPVKVLAVTGQGPALPGALAHRARVRARVGESETSTVSLDVELPLARLAGHRVTLSYTPATADDSNVVNLFGGLERVPVYLVAVRPQLKVDGIVVAVGLEPIDLGARHRLELTFSGPAGGESAAQTLTAGSYLALGIGAQRQAARPDAGGVVGDTEGQAARILAQAALEYGRGWEAAEEELGGLLDVRVLRPMPSLALVGTALRIDSLLGLPFEMVWRGVTLDAALRLAEPLARDGAAATARDWMRLSALQGSALEHVVFEQSFQVDAISADKGLGLARQAGEVIETIDAGNVGSVLPGLQHPANVRADIDNWVRLGYRVEVPRRALTRNSWQGSVWRVEDPTSGAGGYFLAGRLAGGSTTEPPESWVLDFLADALAAPYGLEPNRDPLAGVSIEKIGASDAQEGVVGQVVPQELAVLVRDLDGRPVEGAEVRFLSWAGGGRLGEDQASELVVLTSAAGIASAQLRLGEHTADEPVYLLRNPGDENATKALMHLIEADVATHDGSLAITAPFTAIGFPDEPAGLRRTNSTSTFAIGEHGTFSGLLRIAIEDQYGNPIANQQISFAPGPMLSDSDICSNPAVNPKNLHFFDASLNEAGRPRGCPIMTPLLGFCGTPTLALTSRSDGTVSAGVILGDAVASLYRAYVTSSVLPDTQLEFRWGTSFAVSQPGDHCGELVALFGVPVGGLAGTEGQNINGARPGELFDHAIGLLMLNSVSPYSADALDDGGFLITQLGEGAGARGSWLPARLGPRGAEVNVTNGGSASLPMQRFSDRSYRTFITTGPTPGINEVHFESDDVFLAAWRLNEADNTVYIGDCQICAPFPLRWRLRDVFSVLPTVSGFLPEPVLLTDNAQAATEVVVHYDIAPADYRANSVEMDLLEDGELVGTAQGTQLAGAGAARIQRGFQFNLEKRYTVRFVLNRGGDAEIHSDEVELPLVGRLFARIAPPSSVSQELDLLNGLSCPTATSFQFRLTQPARVTLRFEPIDAVETDGTPIFGTALTLLDNETLPGGDHSYLIAPASTPFAPFELPPGQYRWVLSGVAVSGDEGEEHDGFLLSTLRTRDSLPVGHAIVKGIDLWDGHLSVHREDFKVPGRGVPLAFRRTYSSTTSGEAGPLGMSWGHNYESKVVVTSCGQVIVVGGEGGGMTFVDDGAGGLRPLKGFHGSLVADHAAFTFDFYTKDGTRYHYALQRGNEWYLNWTEDTNGNRTELTYDLLVQPPRLLSVRDAAGRQLSFTYQIQTFQFQPPRPVLTRVQGPDGLAVSFTYDAIGNLSRAEREKHPAAGATPERTSRAETYRYAFGPEHPLENRHLLLAFRDELSGAETSYTYQRSAVGFQGDILVPRANVTSITEPEGGTTTIAIDTAGLAQTGATSPLTTTVTDRRGKITTYQLNRYGSPIEIEDPAGNVQTMTWAADDVVMTRRIDGKGTRTDYTYDEHGNMLSETLTVSDADGVPFETTTGYSYAPPSQFTPPYIKTRVATRTDRKGTEVTSEYDERGNLILQSVDVGGVPLETHHVNLANGDRASTTDANGNQTTYTYDAHGNIATMTDALGGLTRHEWDARGRLTARIDPLGRRTEFEYDVLDRLVTKRLPRVDGEAAAPVERTEYHDAALEIVHRDALDRATTTRLDREGRVVEVEDAAGASKVIEYDPEGNKTLESSWFNASTPRHDTTFGYDDASRMTRRDEPEGKRTVFTVDGVGNVLSETVSDRGPGGATFAPRVTRFAYDELNRPIRVERDFEGGTTIEKRFLDGEGNLVKSEDALGRITEQFFDSLNRLTRKLEPEWAPGKRKETLYGYDGNGNLTTERRKNEPADAVKTMQYDGLNRLIELTDEVGAKTFFEYDAVGNQTKVVDALLNTTRFEYDARNRKTAKLELLTRVSEPARTVRTEYEYDAVGNRTAERWPNGNRVEHAYDALNRLTHSEDQLGQVLDHGYDARGLATRSEDANGNVTTSEYDGLGRVTARHQPENRNLAFDYDVAGNLVGETDARGFRTSHRYDRLNRRIESQDPPPFSYVQRFTYDDAGNRLSEEDRRGQVRTFEYDALNRLIEATDPAPLSYTMSYAYDALGNRTKEIDRRGIETTRAYDAASRLTEVKRGGITLREIEYDAVGNRRFETDANGNVSGFEYDERNLLIAENRPLAAVTRHRLDDMGDRVETTDPEERTTRWTYDGRRRLLSEEDSASAVTTYTVDGNGNRLTTLRPENGLWTFTYDGVNRLVEVIDPLTHSTSFTYDANGNRLSQVDALDRTKSFEYDELNRPTAMVYPDGAREEYGYDANGNRTSVLDAKGQTTTLAYDVLDRLDLVTYSPPAIPLGADLVSIDNTYDPNNNLLSAVETYSDGETRTEARTYDLFDRLLTVTDARGETISYAYDANGNRTRLTDPDGRVTTYVYDALNRIASVQMPGTGISEYAYFKDSRLRTVRYPNGTEAAHSYDAAARLASITNRQNIATVSSFIYLYDANGNRTSQIETQGGAAETTTYTYDAADRLTGVVYPDRTVDYVYDEVGNRSTERVKIGSAPPFSRVYGYDSRDRLLSLSDGSDPAASLIYTYDANGNQVSRTQNGVTSELIYDVRDQLREVRRAATLFEAYQYDYRGLRIKKAGPAGVFRYVYDDSSVLVETDDAGGTVAKFDYGPDRLLAMTHATEGRQFYLFDGLHSVANLMRTDGSIVARYQYDAWGNPRATVGSSFNRFGFTSQERDAETGLYYFKARYYDPEAGRFLSEDPADGVANNPPSLHRYLYAHANPTVFVDPTGRASEKVEYKWTNEDDIPGGTEYYVFHHGGQVIYYNANFSAWPEGFEISYNAVRRGAEEKKTKPMSIAEHLRNARDSLIDRYAGDAKKKVEEADKEFNERLDRSMEHGDEEFEAEKLEGVHERGFDDGLIVSEKLGEAAVEAGEGAAELYSDVETGRGIVKTLRHGVRRGPGIIRGQGERTTTREGVDAAEDAAETTARRKLAKPSSETLGRNLEKAGSKRPDGTAAHHIVAGEAPGATEARKRLADLGVDINSAENGVFLPANVKSPNDGGATVHSKLHTKKYYEWVNSMLRNAHTKEQAIEVLEFIRARLLSNNLPFRGDR